jgi:hypothetical protein
VRRINLKDPRTRQRVLLGAALGLLVALMWSRSRGGASTSDTGLVGATTDPTAADAFPSTSGVPAGLGDGGGFSPVTADDVTNAVSAGLAGIDWGSLTSPFADALSTFAAAVAPADESAQSAQAGPAPAPTIDYVSSYKPGTIYAGQGGDVYALQPSGVFQPAYIGPSGQYVSPLTYLGAGVAPTPITSNMVDPPKQVSSGIARPTALPALAPGALASSTPAKTSPPAYTPQTAGVKVAAVTHPSPNVTVTHLSNGTVIEQVKGKTPYVVKRG